MSDVLTITMNPALDVSASTAQVHPTRKLRCDAVQRHPGGGGVNVARVLHRLGSDVAALCMVGGPTGEMLLSLLEAEGVSCVPVAIAGNTRESFTVLDHATAEEYRFVLPGPAMNDEDVAACMARLAWQAPPDFLVISGSLPPGVPVDFHQKVVSVGHAWGSKVILDVSGPALLHAMESRGVFLVKPSLREFRELTQAPLVSVSELIEAAQAWVDKGWAEVVVVSLGAQGAVMVSGGGVVYAPALQVAALSAVGAGDSFVGGMVWALADKRPLNAAFRYGVASATATLQQPGGALCLPEDVHEWFGKVQCDSDLEGLALCAA